MGLAAKNAILLVDRALKNHDERGMEYIDAFREAVTTRIRPIFMTTLAMVFGHAPDRVRSRFRGRNETGNGYRAHWRVLCSAFSLRWFLCRVTFLSVDKIRNKFVRSKPIATEIQQ